MSRQVALRFIGLAELRLKASDPEALTDAETFLWKALEVVREERLAPQPIGVVLARALRGLQPVPAEVDTKGEG